MIVHDGAFLLKASLNILLGGRDALHKIFEEKHVERLSEKGAGDTGSCVGDEIGMDDKHAEEAAGTVMANAAVKKLI
jgi:hypothetical protein